MASPALALAISYTPALSQASASSLSLRVATSVCAGWEPVTATRNPTVAELRCRFGVRGSGRFGLAVHMDVPVYQPRTPLPGTHAIGLSGLPAPGDGESYEEWEWRLLRAEFGPEVRRVERGLEFLEPRFAALVIQFESQLQRSGVRFRRRETWRSPDRQAYLFQQGRSRPGSIVTGTLTSWHSFLDGRGVPSALAVDYDVPRAHMRRFHEYVEAFGFESYGADSNDPGHIYMVGARSITPRELVFLRTLPKVPAVTIATGRPMDESVSREERDEYRRLALAWVNEPFLRLGIPPITLVPPVVSMVGAIEPPASPPPPEPGPRPTGLLQIVVEWLRKR